MCELVGTRAGELVCYLDESADSGPPPVSVVAGFVAYATTGDEIDDKGTEILRRYGAPLLHAKDLFRRKGPYAAWCSETSAQFASEIVALALHHRLVGVIGGVDSARHKLRKAETGLSNNQSAYGGCFDLINNATLRAYIDLPNHSLLYRWETRGKKDREIATSLHNITAEHGLDHFLSGIEFIGKDAHFGVQLADLLAFLARRQAQAKLRGDEGPDRHYTALEPLLDLIGFSFVATDMG